MPSSAPADGADYIPAETFSGSKLGYVFQSGTQGTGYYKDGVDKGLPPPPTPAGLTQPLTKQAVHALRTHDASCQQGGYQTAMGCRQTFLGNLKHPDSSPRAAISGS